MIQSGAVFVSIERAPRPSRPELTGTPLSPSPGVRRRRERYQEMDRRTLRKYISLAGQPCRPFMN
jgi:hypothetical protein